MEPTATFAAFSSTSSVKFSAVLISGRKPLIFQFVLLWKDLIQTVKTKLAKTAKT